MYTAIASTSSFEAVQQSGLQLPLSRLQWRQGKLFVKSYSQSVKYSNLHWFTDLQHLEACLRNSSVQIVCIDSSLGATALETWANVCERANKPLFLRMPAPQKSLKPSPSLHQSLQSFLDWCLALLLVIGLSPFILIITGFMQLSSSEPILDWQWQVGKRGKLFRAFQFRFCRMGANPWVNFLGTWLCKYNLDKVPQLLNVLRAEMNLRGTDCLSLTDAVQLSYNS